MTDAAPVGHPGSLGLIWAQARGGVIGAGGTMPWHLPEDLAHFRAATMGAPVIMGRRTWESFPDRFRPLPGRRNIVVTRDPEWADAGAEAAGSLDEALALSWTSVSVPESAPRATSSASAHTDVARTSSNWRGDEVDAVGAASDVWVIGGGELYRAAIAHADVLEVTEIDLDVNGDTMAPEIDLDVWRVASVDPVEGWRTSRTGLRYRFFNYVRS